MRYEESLERSGRRPGSGSYQRSSSRGGRRRHRKGRKRASRLLAVVFLFAVLLAGGWFYADSLTFKVCSVEAGVEVRAQDFFKNPTPDAVFAKNSPEFDIHVPGEYKVRVKSGLFSHECTLRIQDTILPQAEVHSVELNYGQICRPEDFVTEIQDATAVTVEFEQPWPDFGQWGEQDIVLRLCDLGGNMIRKETKLYIAPVLAELEREIGAPVPAASEFVLAGSEIKLLTEDISTAQVSRQPVDIEIDGVVYHSILSIVDTVPPVVEVRDVAGFVNTPVAAADFMVSVQDATAVTAAFDGEPDITVSGSREVSLVFTDEGGNEARASAMLTLEEDREPPVIIARDINYVMGTTMSYKKNVTVSDNSGAELQLNVDNSQVDLEKEGVYPVTYSATDSAGNTASVTVNVTVIPMTYDVDEVYGYADAVLASIFEDGMSQYDKIRAIYDYVKANVGYISHSDKGDWVKAAYEGLVKHQGDCYVYACTTKVLLDRAEIVNMDIEKIPSQKDGSMHYWNLVDIGEGWHHLDTTPRKDHPVLFYLTEAEIMDYSRKHDDSHNYDHELYPKVP